MNSLKVTNCIILLGVFLINVDITLCEKNKPLVIITWDYENATKKAWQVLNEEKRSAIDAIEAAGSLCEEQQCRGTVGFGGSPDESGETTLDAMIMDGVKMDVGAVGNLRNIKNAIGVARKVLDNTKHSLLGGEMASEFAWKMGFKKESLQTVDSRNIWLKWKENKCQPNYWKNVQPDPTQTCGPYDTLNNNPHDGRCYSNEIDQSNHDTIGLIAMDMNGDIAAGTSTNGAKYKIPGRIGDSPIPGAGAYADQDVGAAAATGDGDIMMRFLPSFLAVEEMRRGTDPVQAAKIAIQRIVHHYSNFFGAVIAFNKEGQYGAACNGMPTFPYYVMNSELEKISLLNVSCYNS